MDKTTGSIALEDSNTIKLFLDLNTEDARARDVYHKKIQANNHRIRICRIHFYYFKISNNKLQARHYFKSEPNVDPNLWTDFMHDRVAEPYPTVPGRQRKKISNALKDLIVNARTNGQSPPPSNKPINRIQFQERSFLAFFFDHDGWEFPNDRTGGPESDFPAVFFTEDAKLTKNHSFFDGATAQINIEGKIVPVFYMVNHAKRNEQDDDLIVHDDQAVKFNVVVKIPMQGTTEKLTVMFDPGGNNLGPPDPP